MNFSKISDHSFIGRALRLPLAMIPKHWEVRIVQGRLRGKKWIVGASTHGCWLGSYEYDKQRLFSELIPSGAVVYDLGANVGFYTVLASTLVGPSGRVFAFEPVNRNVEFLVRHVALNELTNVDVLEVAVSDTVGIASFAHEAGPSCGALSADGSISVRTTTLDHIVFEERRSAPDYVKIDIEGGEVEALVGARKTLNIIRPTIFLATHGRELHRRCCELLRELRYRVLSVDSQAVSQTDELLAIPLESSQR